MSYRIHDYKLFESLPDLTAYLESDYCVMRKQMRNRMAFLDLKYSDLTANEASIHDSYLYVNQIFRNTYPQQLKMLAENIPAYGEKNREFQYRLLTFSACFLRNELGDENIYDALSNFVDINDIRHSTLMPQLFEVIRNEYAITPHIKHMIEMIEPTISSFNEEKLRQIRVFKMRCGEFANHFKNTAGV